MGDERKVFEDKIEELTRANDKCSQYIAKREQEHRHREKISLNIQQIDQTKRKYNDEIHRLYDQVFICMLLLSYLLFVSLGFFHR